MTTATKITELNDAFRTTFIGGKVVMTEGIHALSDVIRNEILSKVRAFNNFTPDNDPYQEHDFGSLEQNEYRIFWKIDYYDLAYKYGSEEPANSKVTRRVLTIMLAEEY